MSSAAQLRQQIEAALANRIPSALTPHPRVIRPTAPTGIGSLDVALGGGVPLGAITEVSGNECSGRTSIVFSFIYGLTRHGQVCAWVDASDALHPESASAAGIDLARLLWIRCGPEPEQLPLPGFSDNPSPAKRPRSPAPQPLNSELQTLYSAALYPFKKPWTRLDQALRATDLLLNAGGFAAIVLDMGSIAAEFALRVPLATWFRYRAAAERTQASVLLITQRPCTQSSAGLVLHCQPGSVDPDSTTVYTGAEHHVEIARERFASTGNITEFTRKPPQSDYSVLHSRDTLRWQIQTPWSLPHPKAGRP